VYVVAVTRRVHVVRRRPWRLSGLYREIDLSMGKTYHTTFLTVEGTSLIYADNLTR